jgi:hypothetical protein
MKHVTTPLVLLAAEMRAFIWSADHCTTYYTVAATRQFVVLFNFCFGKTTSIQNKVPNDENMALTLYCPLITVSCRQYLINLVLINSS